MVEWRDRGYVQDSDDDDSISDGGGQDAAVSDNVDAQDPRESALGPHNGFVGGVEKPTRAKGATSQPEINTGQHSTAKRAPEQYQDIDELDAGHESSHVLFSTGHRTPSAADQAPPRSQDVFDIPPSPPDPEQELEPLPNSLKSSISSPLSPIPAFAPSRSTSPDDQKISKQPVGVIPSQPSPVEEATTRGRTFRQRNPIQLHPYLLESETYRNSLRARGIRPIHVANEELRRQQESFNDDTQWQAGVGQGSSQSLASEIDNDVLFSSSPPRLQSSQISDQREADSNDDLPSLEDLSKRPVPDGLSKGHKRQKLLHRGQRLSSSEHGSSRNDIHDQQPSELPPLGASRHPSKLKRVPLKKFKYPKGYEPTSLLTPGPSSDSPRRVRDTIEIDSDFNANNDGRKITSTSPQRSPSRRSSRARSRSLSSTGSRKDAELRRNTKRIKGVLPASWLRIDQQAQHVKSKPQRKPSRSVSPADTGPQRGVAHRIQRSGPLPFPRAYTPPLGEMSEESEDEESGKGGDDGAQDDGSLHRSTSTVETARQGQALGFKHPQETQDAEVGDWIDPMLPSGFRRHHSPRKRRKRQTGLKDAFARGESLQKSSNFKPPADVPHGSSKRRAKTQHRPRARPLQNKFSIVDAAGAAPRTQMPDFIRVAIRQVQKHPTKGRHSPTGKEIHLHEQQDAKRIEKSLRDWKNGRVRAWNPPISLPRAQAPSRLPLGEQAGNQQTRLPPSVKSTTDSKKHVQTVPYYTGLDSPTPPQAARPRKKQQSRLQLPPSDGHSAARADHGSMHQARPSTKARQRVARKLETALLARPGQLEDFQLNRGEEPQDAFRDNLQDLDQTFDHQRQYSQRTANPLLGRFLSQEPVDRSNGEKHGSADSPTPTVHRFRGEKKRGRKRQPQMIPQGKGITILDFENHFPDEAAPSAPATQAPPDGKDIITGLAPYGAQYTTDFDVRPLPAGTYFHHSTFIGSYELQDALHASDRSMDTSNGLSTVSSGNSLWRWNAWNEDVASKLHGILQSTSRDPFNDIAATLRTTVRYFASSLYFSDPPDQIQFVTRMTSMLKASLEQGPAKDASGPQTTDVAMYRAVLGFQVREIAKDPLIPAETQAEAARVFAIALRSLARAVILTGMHEIKILLEDINELSSPDLCMTVDRAAAQSLVVLKHLCRGAKLPDCGTWDFLGEQLASSSLADSNDVAEIEQHWSDAFQLLPFFEIDCRGIIRPGSRFQAPSSGWSFLKRLTTRVLELYGKAADARGSTINSYLRAVMTRSLTLIQQWGWSSPEPILGCLFDFFARRGFAFLKNEGSKGSPKFLENLDQQPEMVVDPADRSFDIFLKILASSLSKMRSSTPAKRMKNLIWRFVPNHGRRHAKEAELHEDDLDAIRNQHNLLSVLYWTSPPSFRLATSRIRSLVDIKISHSEVVRINIRSWTNLARFQLSTGEEVSTIQPFAEWYNDMMRSLVELHRSARREAEATFLAVNGQYNGAMSKDVLESVIARNERQVEGLIAMLLASLNSLVSNGKNKLLVRHLFEQFDSMAVSSLFDTKKPRLFKHIAQLLDTYQLYFQLCMPSNSHNASTRQEGEDSQDFGDWSDIEALADDPDQTPGEPSAQHAAFSEVQRILSNCFGAESFFDEMLLTKITDTWVHACRTMVKLGTRTWNHFLDPHSSGSWSQLRDTEQTRIYGVYFYSQVTLKDDTAYRDSTTNVLLSWFTSLVERESMLKYQGMFTSALLGSNSANPMLQNLPFWKAPTSDTYEVTLADIRERRLNLISTVLANIRHAIETAPTDIADSTQKLRQDSTTLVKGVMSEMKRIYQETQHGSPHRGAYVDFVQKIIEYLQQYTAEIVPIDKFFTDSGAFPLPATDPTYVVGRLKRYSSTLSDEASQKQLSAFLHNVCERAAADNQQDYLVGQLSKSVGGTWEDPEHHSLSLRIILLEGLFPVYLSKIFAHPCGWIFALPILEAASLIFSSIHHSFNTVDTKSVCAISGAAVALLRPIQAAVAHVARDTTLLYQAHVNATLHAIFDAATSILPVVDYSKRLSRDEDEESEAVTILRYLHDFAASLINLSSSCAAPTQETQDMQLPTPPPPPPSSPSSSLTNPQLNTIRTYTSTELTHSLNEKWSREGDSFFVRRNRERREVVVDVATVEKELEDLIGGSCEGFVETWRRMVGLR